MTVFLCSKAPKRREENVVECIRLTQIAHDDLKIQFFFYNFWKYKSNLFQFPLKVQVIRSRLYVLLEEWHLTALLSRAAFNTLRASLLKGKQEVKTTVKKLFEVCKKFEKESDWEKYVRAEESGKA